jgi:hypothetical protein
MSDERHLWNELMTAGVVGLLPAGYPHRHRVDVLELADALLAAPLPALAITTDHPDAPYLIQACRRRSGPHMLVGIFSAGTRWTYPAAADFALGPAPPPTFATLYVPWRSGVARLPGSDRGLRPLPALAGAVAAGFAPRHQARLHAAAQNWLVGPALFPEPYAGMGDLITRVRRLREACGGGM